MIQLSERAGLKNVHAQRQLNAIDCGRIKGVVADLSSADLRRDPRGERGSVMSRGSQRSVTWGEVVDHSLRYHEAAASEVPSEPPVPVANMGITTGIDTTVVEW